MSTIIIGDIAAGSVWWSTAHAIKVELERQYKHNNAFMQTWKQVTADVRIHAIMRAGKPVAFIYTGSAPFKLYPAFSRPFWNKGMRTETWMQGLSSFIRLTRKDGSWTPVTGYTLTKISPRDTLVFLHLVKADSDFFKNSSKYVFEVNGIVLDRYVETANIKTWLPNTSYTDSNMTSNISVEVNSTGIGYAVDEASNHIVGYYFARINGGVGGIIDDPAERMLIDPAFYQGSNGLFTSTKLYSNATGVTDGTGPLVGAGATRGTVRGTITYETISADPNYLFRSEVNTTKDSFSFFSVDEKAPAISLINNPANKDVHYILPV